VAPIIERIGSGCTSNLMRVLIRLTAPSSAIINAYPASLSRCGVGVLN
jgi:hypothetical protein